MMNVAGDVDKAIFISHCHADNENLLGEVRTLVDRFAGIRIVDARSKEARALSLKTIANLSLRNIQLAKAVPSG